jgi:hypothetical protein
MNKYAALLWPLLGGVVMVVLQSYQDAAVDHSVSASEWVTVVIQAFTLVTIWAAANVPGFSKAKAWVGATMLALNLLVSLIVGGLTGTEVAQLVVAFLGAVGVFVTPGPVHPVVRAVR